MIRMTKLAVLLLFTQLGFTEISPSHAGDIEEGIFYPYPFFYDDTDSFSTEDASKHESKNDSSKNESSSAGHGTIGKIKITVEVENTDYLSQCQAEWEKGHKKHEPQKESKKNRRSHFSKDEDNEKEDKKDDHSPKARFLIEWGKD